VKDLPRRLAGIDLETDASIGREQRSRQRQEQRRQQ